MNFPPLVWGGSKVVGYTNIPKVDVPFKVMNIEIPKMRAVKQGYVQMREVRVNTLNLLATVKTNREKHRSEYVDAMRDYKTIALAKLEEVFNDVKQRINILKEGQAIQLGVIAFNVVEPQDHTKDYDQVIKMLEMSVDKEMQIRSDEFACYVMDDWGWKEEWRDTYTSNKAMTMALTSAR